MILAQEFASGALKSDRDLRKTIGRLLCDEIETQIKEVGDYIHLGDTKEEYRIILNERWKQMFARLRQSDALDDSVYEYIFNVFVSTEPAFNGDAGFATHLLAASMLVVILCRKAQTERCHYRNVIAIVDTCDSNFRGENGFISWIHSCVGVFGAKGTRSDFRERWGGLIDGTLRELLELKQKVIVLERELVPNVLLELEPARKRLKGDQTIKIENLF